MTTSDGLAVIIMGSQRDLTHAREIAKSLETYAVPYELRIASAHKSTTFLVNMLTEYESSRRPIVYIAIAGRSNALAGVVDANVSGPVITCPPTSSAFGGADIYSSLRMPSGVAPMVVLEPEGAALAAAKCFSLCDAALRQRIRAHQSSLSDSIVENDREVRGTNGSQLL